MTVAAGEPVELRRLPDLDMEAFGETVADSLRGGLRAAALFGDPLQGPGARLYAVLADDTAGRLRVARGRPADGASMSLSAAFPQLHLFEREYAEQPGIHPHAHPWLMPVRMPPARADGAPRPLIGAAGYAVAGAQVHEVAVGPVHAGVIEPGHFRFQCHGEEVLHLEIALGYQHRGVERALAGGPDRRTIHYMETLAGDTTIGHATAYCEAIEALAGAKVPPRAQMLRAIALELERLANHIGDLGALAADVGYLPTASYCGRLRGDFLNMTAAICGSRFGRGLVRPGGVGFDVDGKRAAELADRLDRAMRDVTSAVNLLWITPSVMARFEETGAVARATAEAIGLVGPAARACGIPRDVRHDFPSGAFRFVHVPVTTWHGGDVFARAWVRWMEIQQSARFVREQVRALPAGALRSAAGRAAADKLVVSMAEGWRGEICHVAITGGDGRFRRYKVVDPSFHNWTGLALALRGQQIFDFPLCNKSFNLSYCGHDL